MICWRCSRPVAKDLVACPHCAPIPSQNASADSYEDEVQVGEHGGGEIQSSAQWASAAPSTYQQVTVPVERDSRLMWSGLTTILLGSSGFIGAAGGGGAALLIFGVIIFGCGVLTLAVSRFGARPLYTLTWQEQMLTYPGFIIGQVFARTLQVIQWLFQIFARSS